MRLRGAGGGRLLIHLRADHSAQPDVLLTFLGLVLAAATAPSAPTRGETQTPAAPAPKSEPILLEGRLLVEGLSIEAGDGLRERTGLSVDPIEALLVRGVWSIPKAGSTVRLPGGAASAWSPIHAEDGWFEGKALEAGYVHLTVQERSERISILQGMGHDMVFVNGEPRAGNPYGLVDSPPRYEPRWDYSRLPIRLRAGANSLLFKCNRGRLRVRLVDPPADAFLNVGDVTIPDLLVGEKVDAWAGIVVVNASNEPLKGATLEATLEGGEPVATPVPTMVPLGIRKIPFRIQGASPQQPGEVPLTVRLLRSGRGKTQAGGTVLVPLAAVPGDAPHRRTFISDVDGSVQYYAINPARPVGAHGRLALFLSLHGANVEAIGHARAYAPKTWGHIVAPTNRRPYGYNWEEWGRLDALEVLAIAERELDIDPDRVYLTGHSMGGHGTWHLAETYPDRFAAIGPSAGWLSFWSYRARKPPDDTTPIGKILARTTTPSDTLALAQNLRAMGIYVLHGSEDDNVPASESRRMVDHLRPQHQDLVYFEQPGAGHWWDLSQEPGSDCVDWTPMFDFFARHARPGPARIRKIEFATASPGISSTCYWLSVEGQTLPLAQSRASVRFDPGLRRFEGTTVNVSRLAIDVSQVAAGGTVEFALDGERIQGVPLPSMRPTIWLARAGQKWEIASPPAPEQKGPRRYGTLRDAFRNRFVLVYGTGGSKEERTWALAKARYDAERFLYQGNGSMDILSDAEFSPSADRDRSVILYGNAATNSAWTQLLRDSPVQVDAEGVTVGERRLAGRDLACLFVRPRPGSAIASVGVIAGSGIEGMRLAGTKLYLEAGYPFPDCLVFGGAAASAQDNGIVAAGFFGPDWSVASGDFAWSTPAERP